MKDPKERASLSYENKSAEYRVQDADAEGFQKQFYFIYRARIEAMTQRIVDNGKQILGPKVKISQLADVKKEGEFFVIGVILKKMKYRRSVLYGFTDEETMETDFREKLRSENLTSDEDTLELEDYQQIIKLGGDINKDQFVSGNVIGVFGYQEKDDLFHVTQVVLPMLAPQIPWPMVESDSYILFVSGLALGSKMEQNEAVLFALDKLSKWVCGEMVLSEKELEVVSNVNRVVMAGESIRISDSEIERQKVDFLGTEEELDKGALSQFDDVLSRIVNSVPVDVMPGPNDPASVLVPQQPIPRMVFPTSRRFGKLLNPVTNPYKCSLGGMVFQGTSGQNIEDLLKLTSGLTPLDLMQKCLEQGHLFPTVPDSIDGFPFQNRDPLVVDELPHIFFAGNQESLSSRMVDHPNGSRTLLLTIPMFYKTQCAVVLNLKNLKVKEYDFSQINEMLF